jgi:GTP-binding protein
MAKPIVALVGRPNVGKSTLFNRLARERLAVVDAVPGTTRDRLTAEAEWNGVGFTLVDTGGIEAAGQPADRALAKASADYLPLMRAQAEQAVLEADAVLFLVDAQSGPTPADQEVADVLRRLGPARRGVPVLLVANKADNPARRQEALQFHELGMGEAIPISALHGSGVGDLLDVLVQALGVQPGSGDELLAPQAGAGPAGAEWVRIAIVGRPNVGKSTLLNRLLGEERMIVSAIPGTTRDAVDTRIDYQGQPLVLIDTAGIRRRGRILPGVEKYSVLRALKAIDRAEVALLLLDAVEGVTAQDAHIAGLILERLRSAVLLVNKWDAVPQSERSQPEFAASVRRALNFLDYVPALFISALTGEGVEQVLPTALQVQEQRLRQIPNADLNRIVAAAQERHAPPSKAGKQLRIYSSEQLRADPPTFLFRVNDPRLVHFSYSRFLENRLRDQYGFLGTPIRLTFRRR